MNSIEHLLQGKSDRAVAEAVGVSRQTISEWKNHDPLFIAELNRQRSELWWEAHQRLKSLANRALDVVELQLDSGDPKASLAASKYILQGTRLLGDTDLPRSGPTTPEAVILEKLRSEAKREIAEADRQEKPMFPEFGVLADMNREIREQEFANKVEDLAKSRLKRAMAEAGLS